MKLEVKRPEKYVEFCLDGDLYGEYETAKEELDLARRKAMADKRLNDPAVELARKLIALGDKIRGESVRFLLRGMPRKRWATLMAENPPRDGDAVDKAHGFNVEAVMIEAIPESIISVTKDDKAIEFTPAEDWSPTADDMTDIQYEDFVVAVLSVNRGRQEVPFSLDAYRRISDSDKT
ncbi:hypothetical protein [Arthrobacter roseus]|uniref:hypothetical protein n=1 Tax=Arthrobacter roseus TaxID=136274 RepID=UPI001964DEA7|nr:hypothetical protein [Arthrobacter roseus]MBM7847458.1 hypothetical protein [Arthrobacter roseus]